MKIIFSLLLFGLFHLGFSQNKTETIDWIMSKMTNSPISDDGILGYSTRFIKINYNGEFTITERSWRKDQTPTLDDPVFVTTFTGNMKDLNPNSVILNKEDGLVYIHSTCTNSKNCISQKTHKVIGSKDEYFTSSSVVFGWVLPNSEPNITDRLKKAFIQLITLCGGKKEAF